VKVIEIRKSVDDFQTPLIDADESSIIETIRDFLWFDKLGDEIRLVKAEMTEEKYEAMPEFQGW